MARFDRKKFKKNITTVCIMILSVIVLVLVESFLSPKEIETQGLGSGSIQINKLVINEVMTSNKGAYNDPDGNSYDWIELYNGSAKDIDLSGYGLSDADSGSTKWIFPSVTIKSKEYLIVYLASTNKQGLYANFSLNKAGGETLTLKTKSGKVVDSVKTLSIDKNTVMARNENGSWVATAEITPGYANNEEGRKNYLTNRKQADDVVITEFLPNNKGNVDIDGRFYGYIEIQNQGEKEVSLKDYFVSNDPARPFLFRLPDITLKPQEVYVIYTSELDRENHALFALKKKSGSVILSKKDKVVEEETYEDISGGFAMIRLSDGSFRESSTVSPGYANTNEGMEQYVKEKRKNPNDLMINEVMSSNRTYLMQNGGEYYDWIELYNNTDHTIQLGDYALTNNDDNQKLYVLPNVELKSHEYYVIMASGDTNLSNSKYQHANFKISPSESLYLHKNDVLVDSVFVSNIPIGYSYGRGSNYGFYYYATPTPLARNNQNGILEIAYEPSFSVKPGVYNNQGEIALELEGAGTIYYTLDGSIPTQNSKVYDSPILLDKTTVVRAVAYEDKKKASAVVTGSYIINEDHTLPVLSISLPNSSFQYISSNPDLFTTVNAHVEFYEKDGSFSLDCGLKLFGGQTRYIPKKSFALKFSSEYGPSKLNYRVFENRDAVSYDTLVVRSGSQDSVSSMIRDELATSIMDDYGTVDVQAYKPTILYINGNYWGVYFLREKVDEEFIAHHYEVPEEGSNIIRIDNVATVGASRTYYNVRSYIQTHDMSSDSAYQYVSERLDIDNFIDFWVGQIFVTNNDIVNTRFFSHPEVDNGKLKMIFYDFDYAFYHYDRNQFSWLLNPEGMGEHYYDNSMLRGLMNNKNFKQRFLERLSYNFKNVWTDEHVLKRYQELVDLIQPEMARNQSRWKLTYQDWTESCEILKNYLLKRREYVISQAKSFFNLSSEEVKKYFG